MRGRWDHVIRTLLAGCAAVLGAHVTLLGACDRSRSEPAERKQETAAPTETEWVPREIPDYRVRLKTPRDWKIEKSKTRPFYSVRAPSAERRGGLLRLAQVAVGLQPGVPTSLEAAAQDCGGGSAKGGDRVVESEQLPSGAYYVLCEHQVLDQPHGRVTTILPVDGGQSVHCVGSGRGDLALEKAVCRSLSRM